MRPSPSKQANVTAMKRCDWPATSNFLPRAKQGNRVTPSNALTELVLHFIERNAGVGEDNFIARGRYLIQSIGEVCQSGQARAVRHLLPHRPVARVRVAAGVVVANAEDRVLVVLAALVAIHPVDPDVLEARRQ